MVAIHAAVIGYIRSRVAQVNEQRSTAFEIGEFRFQPVADPQTVYHFRLHAIIDPSKRQLGEERLSRMRMEILESSEQMLRQVDPAWLDDPSQVQIRERLMEVILQHLELALIQRVLITDWLELPVASVQVDLRDAPPRTPNLEST